MASTYRYRAGVVKEIALPTANDGDVTHSIEEGDLVVVIGGVAYPAKSVATTAALKAAFAGVALQKTGLQSGEFSFNLPGVVDKGYVIVATTGVFEFDCASGISWAPGSLVEGVTSNGACKNQQVALASTYATAIGVAVVPYKALGSTTQTSMWVDIKSELMHADVLSGQ